MVRWPREQGMWILVGALVALLAVLGVLQYRWTGEIGRAEAERQRARLERSARRFAQEVVRDVGQVRRAFLPDLRPEPGDPAEPRTMLLRRLRLWRQTEQAMLVSRVVLFTSSPSGALVAEAADAADRGFVPTPVPPALEAVASLLETGESRRAFRGGLHPRGFVDDGLTLIVPLVEPTGEPGRRFGPGSLRLSGVAAVELSEEYLRDELFPRLAEAHFGPLDEGDYAVAVVRRRDGGVVYSSDLKLGPGELARGEVRLALPGTPGWPGLQGLEPDRRFGPGGPMGRAPVARRDPGDDAGPAPRGPDDPGPGPGPEPPGPRPRPEGVLPGLGGPGENATPWTLVVRHRGGSLTEAVAAVRRRHLAVGLGVLALLGAAVVLLAVGGQRARRLARQQLEFVAGVTHELHTPLAAIRSAGQNLADGVVADPAQVRRYGDLIQKEGGRLSALVAQVLDFAGIESGAHAYSFEPVSLGPLVNRAVGDLGLVIEQAGMKVEIEIPTDLPDARGDPAALRRALENLLTNATKFAREGGWIGIRARCEGGGLTLRVEDRGPGIPKAERERVFEPFYRGKDARGMPAPGSGLGLSLVRHVVEAHGGRARVETRAEGGTAVVVDLPIAAAEEELA